MGDSDGLRRFPPLDKGKISEFLEKTMSDAEAEQDRLLKGEHAPVPGAKISPEVKVGHHAPDTAVKPASLPEIAARTGMTREMAMEIRERTREIADMLDGADTGVGDTGERKTPPASPLRQIDEASMATHKLIEEALDSIQTIHRQLFG